MSLIFWCRYVSSYLWLLLANPTLLPSRMESAFLKDQCCNTQESLNSLTSITVIAVLYCTGCRQDLRYASGLFIPATPTLGTQVNLLYRGTAVYIVLDALEPTACCFVTSRRLLLASCFPLGGPVPTRFFSHALHGCVINNHFPFIVHPS